MFCLILWEFFKILLLFLKTISFISGAQEIYSNSHISPNSARRDSSEVPLPAIVRSDPVEIYSSEQQPESSLHRHYRRHTHEDSHVLLTRSADPIQRTNEDILNFKNFPDTIVDNDIELSGMFKCKTNGKSIKEMIWKYWKLIVELSETADQ